MRPALIMLALALAACSIRASATDVDFEMDSNLFEKAAASRRNPNPFRLSAIKEKRSYDHPIYEGLWSMTITAFRDSESDDDELDREFESPTKVKQDAFLLANNEPLPLRDSLWKATRDKFEEMEYVWGNFSR